MRWKSWKLGAGVAVFASLIVAGAGLDHGMTWWMFTRIFCAALATHFLTFIKDHPPEQVKWDDSDPPAAPKKDDA